MSLAFKPKDPAVYDKCHISFQEVELSGCTQCRDLELKLLEHLALEWVESLKAELIARAKAGQRIIGIGPLVK